jgi:hypothetical protein
MFIFEVIIFDGTGSMLPDLVQLRLAVKDIVIEFSKLRINPIYNYILAVFRDPCNLINYIQLIYKNL